MQLISKTIISIFIVFLFSECSQDYLENDNAMDHNKNEIVEHKQINKKNDSIKLIEIHKKTLEDIYKKIETEKIDIDFVQTFDDMLYWRFINYGILYDETRMNEYIMLFFLKFHHQYIVSNKNNKYGYSFDCCLKSPSLTLFIFQFCKLSNYRGAFLSYYFYEWIAYYSDFSQNDLIKNEINKIEQVMLNNPSTYSNIDKLNETMFYK